MKTKEFMEKVRSFEFGIIQEGHQLVIRTPGCSIVARVNITSQQTEILQFTFGSDDRIELLNIISEYTGTSLAEREEKKRYRLKLTLSAIDVDENMYLALDQETNYKYLKIGILNANDYMVQDIFTESEIAQMDITGFEKVEVAE